MDVTESYGSIRWYRGEIDSINKSEIKILIYKHKLPSNIHNTWVYSRKEIITIKANNKSLTSRIRPINTKTIKLYIN